MVVDKVVPNVLVDGGSRLNILPEHTMKRLGFSLTGSSPYGAEYGTCDTSNM
jgi:hypothetical protein